MISVVIPCYNSAAYIGEHLTRLAAFLAAHFTEYEIMAVNDGSTDNTLEVLNACATDAHIKMLTYSPNKGKGAAVKAGMLEAKGDVIIFTDADLPYELGAIVDFAHALESDADVVLGARNNDGTIAGQRSHRTLLSKLFAALANLVLLARVPDTQAGFKGFTRAAAREIFSKVNIPGFGFDVEAIIIAQKEHMRIMSLPVVLVNQAPSTVRVGRDGLIMFFDLIHIFLAYRLSL